MEDLELKWHNERHDRPQSYRRIIVETTDGRRLGGFVTKDCKFYPEDVSIYNEYSRVSCKRWRYKDYIGKKSVDINRLIKKRG